MSDFQYDGRDLEVTSFAKNYHEWIADLFRSVFGKRVAEVGAGIGSFSELILQAPIDELLVIEPSKEMFEELQKNLAYDTRVTCKNDFFTKVSGECNTYFDSVVYVNVLEHVEDDAGELARVYESLAPGGHVCVFVPALPALYSAHDKAIGHYRRYTKKGLRALLTTAGFEVKRLSFFDFAGIIPWYVVVKFLRKSPSAGNVSLYDNVVVPISRTMETIIHPPIGKNLIAIGKKVG
ncbi:MAG TPA: class I SAM-dependent methyltransferase [Candidatus Paceibacterota bacterium]